MRTKEQIRGMTEEEWKTEDRLLQLQAERLAKTFDTIHERPMMEKLDHVIETAALSSEIVVHHIWRNSKLSEIHIGLELKEWFDMIDHLKKAFANSMLPMVLEELRRRLIKRDG